MGNEREKFVVDALWALLNSTDYRMGALILTCPPTPGMGDVRIVSTVLMKDVRPELAPDLTMLPERMRAIADEIDAIIAGKKPLPKQPK